MKSKQTWHLIELAAGLGLIFIFAGLYWYGASVQLTRMNTDMGRTDQSAYMNFARTMYESHYSYSGERNRMPLYPFIQSLFYSPDMSDEAFFERGKQANLVLSIGLLAGLALIFRRYFALDAWVNLTLIAAFTVFIFKAGYFQAELLFYFLNFCLFLLMWELLKHPSWQWAVLAGITAGLAHLTKASILPGFVIFLVLAGVKAGWETIRNRNAQASIRQARAVHLQLLATILVAVSFLLTVFPYIKTSKRVYGRYFYNVNSTFYIWYDSWEEAKQGTRAYGDRTGWPDLPPEEIPSYSKYLREHTLHQVILRFVYGGRDVFNNMVNSYGYFKYIVIYLGLFLIAILDKRQQACKALLTNPVPFIFLMLYFSAYSLLYAWYAPLVDGNRLILAQFIPLMFVLSIGTQRLWHPSQIKIGGKPASIAVIANFAILLLVVVDIYFILTTRVGTMYGGS